MTTLEFLAALDALLAEQERYPADLRMSAGSLAHRIEVLGRGLASGAVPSYGRAWIGRFAYGKTN